MTYKNPSEAWDRKQTMRDVIRLLAQHGALRLQNAAAIAKSYNVNPVEAEAEMLKYMCEGDGK
jgi:hypothetical protein